MKSDIRLNILAVFTLLLLGFMVMAGLLGFSWGATLGYAALEGVELPETSRGRSLRRQTGSGSSSTVPFLNEGTVLENVKVYTQEQLASQVQPETNVVSATASDRFPLVAQDQGVLLEILRVQKQGNFVELDVSLRNNSNQTVRFLYSFLDITDSDGRPLGGVVEGLPGELDPLGPTFSGTLRIPVEALQGATEVNLGLTDYPDGNVKLSLSGIPVT
ncbi:MAG: hypothetical protein AAGF24_02665 [Cyanobacteria bacterium P01_H01_bin.121]